MVNDRKRIMTPQSVATCCIYVTFTMLACFDHYIILIGMVTDASLSLCSVN